MVPETEMMRFCIIWISGVLDSEWSIYSYCTTCILTYTLLVLSTLHTTYMYIQHIRLLHTTFHTALHPLPPLSHTKDTLWVEVVWLHRSLIIDHLSEGEVGGGEDCQVPGIGKVSAAKIKEQWEAGREKWGLIHFLNRLQISKEDGARLGGPIPHVCWPNWKQKTV